MDGAIRDAHGRVALRKESVDRNQLIGAGCAGTQVSLSARRAWIEMRYRPAAISPSPSVALRKESVDRNMRSMRMKLCLPPVALRKESVDRNCKSDCRNSNKWSLSARRAWIEISPG